MASGTSLSTTSWQRVKRASLEEVTDFGANPTGARMFIYVPDSAPVEKPAVVLGIHWCHGDAQAYYNGTPYRWLADDYGFIVVYPSTPNLSDNCWDVSSDETLMRDGGGDSEAIANMVRWTIDEFDADTSRVFVTGLSSGAMMTNVMAATYPDLFVAGTVYSGVAAGCFASPTGAVDEWNSLCADGQVIKSPEEWATVVRDMYPGYNGTRPKMRIHHGTDDQTLNVQNYWETMKQWAGLLGYDYEDPVSTTQNEPQQGYTNTTWGPNVEGILESGVTHDIQIGSGEEDMEWFGFI
ncbi:acetylxylanesterase aceA [Lineolata rhizophorae]|uniref:Carboxylic ester hydrolase n=1 Tax=Lineolata rhizophorae TaxID=578093 RepID=A0A6A6P9U4_9PEZI|nr:acetylxylanesterase aceA [Lineolata rhizophorae]